MTIVTGNEKLTLLLGNKNTILQTFQDAFRMITEYNGTPSVIEMNGDTFKSLFFRSIVNCIEKPAIIFEREPKEFGILYGVPIKPNYNLPDGEIYVYDQIAIRTMTVPRRITGSEKIEELKFDVMIRREVFIIIRIEK